MSLQALNGENFSDDITAESCAILFTSPEVTGRPSILRPSQKENVPPKGIVKPMKVTFQTPMRDPQTRRILSPDVRKKSETSLILDDCIEVPEDFVFPTSNPVSQETITASTDKAKEGIETEGKVSPDPPDGVIPAKSKEVHASDTDLFKSSDSLLDSPKSQKMSPSEVFIGAEKWDRDSLPFDAICLTQTAAESNPSEETSCKTCSFSLVSLLDGDSPKQLLGSNEATKLAPNQVDKVEPLSISSMQSSSLQHVQESYSFENLNCGEVKEKMEGKINTRTEESSVPKTSYNFDCNDPNFNPFQGGTKMQNSPKRHVPSIEQDNSQADPLQMQQHNPDESEDIEIPENLKEIEEQNVTEDHAAKAETQAEPSSELMLLGDGLPLAPPCGRTEIAVNESSQIDTEKEEFRSPMEVLGMDIEVDYLEQFGMASFKESVLRKQSLYLKFDPLLSESPKKSGANNAMPVIPSLLQNGQFTEMASYDAKTTEPEEKPWGLDLLGTFTDPAEAFLDIPTSNDTSLFPCVLSNEAIIEVLKYSQKDMDAAVEKVKHENDVVVKKLASEVQENQREALEWKKEHDKICIENKEMGKIVAEFEGTITQLMEDSQNQKKLAKKELQKVLEEKQQAISDLNSMEKSFSELFKRFEKQKEAIEGFQRNEEALKKCVEDYLVRIKKEEQRYQALKAHAEEKLHQANEEIAQVRSKAKTEVVALQANLRKEQMRIQSLERSIEQKAKENDELTKLCDDLISKMEKMD
ncbi:transforming acidic coiled-coil-containing protein 3 isoform X2 [Elgaria multicarinata webbii]|uniref:transforming acidic coiled-coil-containing protein 3 isoform X2 n=1 Tax=Elgaria multicarinata webbii TaxID=159646 RepID=UPI002FCCEBF7